MNFWQLLLKDLCSLWGGSKEERYQLKNLSAFSFPEELATILTIAQTYFPEGGYLVNPFALLLAIREAERGRKGLEFGIMIAKDTDLQIQTCYTARTVINNLERYLKQVDTPGEDGFIAFLGARYAPLEADNDPTGLNRHWVKNVTYWYYQFRR
ncbi:MAG: hypothetical protein PWP04_1195 [Candidatus Atribacteria bacterium]|nr:hypothetical protein [Candidatus Atribacteria bacterium]